MHRLDRLLLDRIYQPICNALFERIGDCIVIARAALFHGIAITLCMILVWGIQILWDTHWVPVEMIIFFQVTQVFMIFALVMCRYGLRAHLGNTGPNPLQFALVLPRLVILIWFGLSAAMGIALCFTDVWIIPNACLSTLRDLMAVSGVYFASCHNHPPMRRYARATGTGYHAH